MLSEINRPYSVVSQIYKPEIISRSNNLPHRGSPVSKLNLPTGPSNVSRSPENSYARSKVLCEYLQVARHSPRRVHSHAPAVHHLHLHVEGRVGGWVQFVVHSLTGPHVVAGVQIVAVPQGDICVWLNDANEVKAWACVRRAPCPPAVVLDPEDTVQ